MGWAEQVARVGERRVVHTALVVKPEGKRPLAKPTHRRKHNTKKDLPKEQAD
jgi:hypothetical protein